jgi:ABC-2 type transport system ATP-binding protein
VAADALTPLAHGEPRRDEQSRRLSLPVTGGTEPLAEALRRLSDIPVQVLDIGLRRPDLDDVFLTLTGHAAEDAAPSDGPADSPVAVSAGASR